MRLSRWRIPVAAAALLVFSAALAPAEEPAP